MHMEDPLISVERNEIIQYLGLSLFLLLFKVQHYQFLKLKSYIQADLGVSPTELSKITSK